MEKNDSRRNGRVFHKPTHGAGLTGGIGKIVKVIGGIALFLIVVGVALAAFDNESGSDILEPVQKKIEQIN